MKFTLPIMVALADPL